MRATALIHILLALVLAGSGCTKKEDQTLQKGLNYPMGSDARGFDPVMAVDAYSRLAVIQVYQGLLQFKYLVRPYTTEPLLAAEMPEVSKDGLTYTFRLRQNVFFHKDPAFGGKKRALKASDVVYSFKRIADPHVKSQGWWLFEGRIAGLDEFRKRLIREKTPIDYDDFPVEGLAAPDEKTVVIRLSKPYKQFFYALSMPPASIVAREVVEKYGQEFINHPVGTGPFVFDKWVRGQKITFTKNPNYWDDRYPTEGSEEDRKLGLLNPAGKKLPFVDRVTFWIYVEHQPQWLNFLKGKLDGSGIPKDVFDTVLDDKMNLRDEYKKKKIVMWKIPGVDIVFYVFNMGDKIVGKNKYLRQAMSAAINRVEKIKLFYNNRAMVAHGPIPPGIFGYDEKSKNPYDYDLKKAKALVKKAKKEYHRQGGKGDLPEITYDISSATWSRQMSEALTYDMKQIGLKIVPQPWTWPQLQERVKQGKYQFTAYAWGADYPDPENFLQLGYSKNVSPGPNSARFKNATYDRLFEKMQDMEDGPERLAIIKKMVSILQEETPWIFFNHRIGFPLRHAWLRNYKPNDFDSGQMKYYDVDVEEKKQVLKLLK